MSTAKVINLVHPSGSTNNLVLDNAGNVVGGGTIADSTAILRPKVYGTVNAGLTNPFPSSGGPTSVPFTSIPSWVKRVTLMLNGVSTSSSSTVLFQIGSGSVTSSGYASVGGYAGGSNLAGGTNSTAGFVTSVGNSSAVVYGHVIFTWQTNNTWVCSHVLSANISGVFYSYSGAGTSPVLSGALDRVVATTSSGTATFTAGSINIMYE